MILIEFWFLVGIMKVFGYVEKMQITHHPYPEVLAYRWMAHTEKGRITQPLNDYIGKRITLRWTGKMACINCQRQVTKTFQQGHCYPCFRSLARCDRCIMSPHLCHYDQGTCRQPQWGLDHCMQPHIVYLSETSDLKVGITRKTQMINRWMDQGALAAIPLWQVPTRQISGFVEHAMLQWVKDRTQWQTMLRKKTTEYDLRDHAIDLRQKASDTLALNLKTQKANRTILDDEVYRFNFPVMTYPSTCRSLKPKEDESYQAILWGFKGQYMITDQWVMNIRNHSGYQISLTLDAPE